MREFFDQKIRQTFFAALLTLIFFLIVQSFATIADIRIKARSANLNNSITFRAQAEVTAIPDIAVFQVTIRSEEKDVSAAQQKMSEKSAQLLALLQENKIEKADIKTTNYSTYPKYIYQTDACRNNVCPPTKQILAGYEATQTFSLKLRDISKSGEILSKISTLEITEISGPNLMIDKPEDFKAQAQAQAIAKAKAQAKSTAKNLGIKLGKIVNFHEEPYHHPRMLMAKTLDVSASAMIGAPIEAGEEKISAAIAITYEIKQ